MNEAGAACRQTGAPMADMRPHALSPTRSDVAASDDDVLRPGRLGATTAIGHAELPFRSFWMGGFEGADHLNGEGVALDMAHANGHLDRLAEDYESAAARGLRTVRESIGWRLAEPAPGRFDFARLQRIAQAARRHDVQVAWTLMHYGTPSDIDLRDDRVIDRFALFAARVADTLAPLSDEAPIYNLINEIGFLAWAVSETARMHPYQQSHPPGAADSTASSGYDVKRRLVRAALAGIDAVRAIDRRARFLHIEPVVHVVAPTDRPELQPLADTVCAYQWQAWDLLGGLAEPALGGSPAALDLLGVNHDPSGQWEVGTEQRLWWHLRDPRRKPLAALLDNAWRRYRRPMILAETGHVGSGRTAWLHEVADEVARARAAAVPVGGICLYPLVDRPDWNDAAHWHQSGLWDVELGPSAPAPMRRLLHLECADALAEWQNRLPKGRVRLRRCVIVLTDCRWTRLSGCLHQLLHHLSTDRRIVVVDAAATDRRPDAAGAATDGRPTDPADSALRLDRIVKGARIEVLVPRADTASSGTVSDRGLATSVATYLAQEGIDEADLWFAAPLADPQAWSSALGVRIGRIVYHCDTDWGDAAPESWRHREAMLLRGADLVVTSSSLLSERLGALHGNVHWLPDAVDAERHDPDRLAFACEEADSVRRALQGIATPRFGCIGEVDRSLDLGLVDALAAHRPDWGIVMVGRIDPALADRLPQQSNLHWLGPQARGRLPWFIAACDVCLLPYALNARPRSLCPQPLLEYLAADKPVVATPLPDLVSGFGSCVRVADDPVSFVDACTAALGDSATTRAARAERVRAMLATRSWAANAQRVRWLLDSAER